MCGFKPLFFALVFFFIVGLVLSGFGVLTVVLQGYSLPPQVLQYNELARTWMTYYRPPFRSYSFNFTDFDYNTSTKADANTTPNSFNRDHPEILYQYDALKYVTRGQHFMESPNMTIRPYTLNPYLEIFTLKISSHTRGTNEQFLYPTELRLFYTYSWFECDQQCCKGKGVWKKEQNYCLMILRMKKVCVKISFNPDDQVWSYDTTYGNIGCYKGDRIYYEGEPLYPVNQYEEITVGSGDDFNYTMSVDFSDVEFTLYEAHDPYLYVQNVTNGRPTQFPVVPIYFLFGLANMYLGSGSIVLGSLIGITALVIMLVMCSIDKYRVKYLFGNMTEEHQVLLNFNHEENKNNGPLKWEQFMFDTGNPGDGDEQPN